MIERLRTGSFDAVAVFTVFPWGVASPVLYHDVPCKPCYKSICPLGHHDCLRLVPPGDVVQAARDLLEDPGANGRIK